MDINRANMDLFFQELRVSFTEGMNAAKANLIANMVAMTMPSRSASTVHGWLNQIPQMREWVGDRLVNNIASDKLTVINRKFESTIEVPREDIEDDQQGLYVPLANIQGANAVSFRDELLIEALLRGNPSATNPLLWADGLSYFSDSRVYGANTIDNHVTTAFDEAGTALDAAIVAMQSYLGHSGKPLLTAPTFYLLHGAQLRSKVTKALAAQTALLAGDGSTYVGMVDNPLAKMAIPVQVPYLTDGYVDSKGETHANAGTNWFVVAKQNGMSPLVYQDRIAPEIQDARTKNDSDFVFETDKYQYGVRARGAAFVGLPHLVYGSFATT